MEGEDSDGEDGGRWQPDRDSLMEGTSFDATRWSPSCRPRGKGRQALSPVTPESDPPWTRELCGVRGERHGENLTGSPGIAGWRLGTGHVNKSIIGGGYERRTGQCHTGGTNNVHHQDPSVLQNQGAEGNQPPTKDDSDRTAPHGNSPPLSELCAGTVALCSLYYVRLKKERRLRDSERRRRLFLFRRSKARERLRFAAMLASRLLSAEGTPSGEGQESRVWNTAIEKAFSRFDWMESFRMTKPTFNFLCNQLRPVVRRMDAGMRQAIPVEVRLAVALWHLGSSCDFQTMEEIFGLSCSTIDRVIRDVCEAVASILAPRLVSIPQGDILQETLKGFEHRYGLAQVAGVVGTLHVAIGPSNDSTGQFYNTKGWRSVVLQAVVDPDFCFWDLNVGCPGSLSDSQVLVASELYEQGTEGTLFPNTAKNVNGVEVPIHLLGSRSYPLLPWLMTPLTKESSAADAELNRRFTSALTLTQIAFGRLKSRWRCLLKSSHVDLSFLPILVTACCVLHNICEGRREPFEDHWLEEASEEELEQPSEVEEDDMEMEGAAEEIRTALASDVRT